MAIFNSYWDESGKFKDQKVVSFCGLCLPLVKLDTFEVRWKELLRRRDLPYLKATDALNPRRPLSSAIPAQTVRDRIEALKPFASCIADCFELGVALAVNVGAFNRTRDHIKKRISGGEDPFLMAFSLAMATFAYYRRERDSVAVIFDDDEGTAGNCLKLYRRMRTKELAYHGVFASITFADDQVYMPLQASDLLAALIRREAERRFFGKRFDYEPLFAHMVEPRGDGSIRWRAGFIGEQSMAKIELSQRF